LSWRYNSRVVKFIEGDMKCWNLAHGVERRII